MDVDIIFRRGYAYTLATLCVLGAFYGVVFSLGSLVQKNFKDLGNTGLVTVMLLTAFLFQPIRNWIQERLDKHFYRDRYDYRRTLVEFARELSSETDLDAMLASVGERLLQTLSIRHLAFFLADEKTRTSGCRKRMGDELPAGGRQRTTDLDLASSTGTCRKAYIFFERTRHQLDAVSRSWPASVRKTIADLDLTYYLPCTVRGRTIAYLGVSRTADGDYLSSVDVELLVTLAGYVGIAIENATLYRSLQRKVEEYERLKEFSENIVESINVGILAADLEDRVESWNTQLEQLSGIPARLGGGADAEPSCFRWNWPSSSTACAARPASTTSTSSCSSRWRAEPAYNGQRTQRQRAPWRWAGTHGHAPARGHAQRSHRAPGIERCAADRPPDHLRRRHRPRRTRATTGAGRQAEQHRAAGGGSGARSEHAAGGDLHVRADAGQAGGRTTSRNRCCWTRSPSRPSAPARSSTRC